MLKIKQFKGMGRGLVSTQNILKGQVIHIAEIIALNRQEARLVDRTILSTYVYDLGLGRSAIALGMGSLFNHKSDNNIDFTLKKIKGRTMIVYKANRLIPAGQQLFLNYGYEP